jgi:hypothetical protein
MLEKFNQFGDLIYVLILGYEQGPKGQVHLAFSRQFNDKWSNIGPV